MKDKKLANSIARAWNAGVNKEMKTVMTKATVEEYGKAIDDVWYQVRINPIGENDGRAFHYVGRLHGIAAAFIRSSYVTIEDGKVVGVIF